MVRLSRFEPAITGFQRSIHEKTPRHQEFLREWDPGVSPDVPVIRKTMISGNRSGRSAAPKVLAGKSDDMYANYWGLAEIPFKNTLDTRWFYESSGHEEA